MLNASESCDLRFKAAVSIGLTHVVLRRLFVQHCKLLSFLTLVTHMKPDRVALTGATKRDAFLAYTPDMKWSQVPLGSLWDEESISELLAGVETADLLPSDINIPVQLDFVHLLSPKMLHRAQHCLDAHAHFP